MQHPEVLIVNDLSVRLAGSVARLVSQNGDEGIDLVVATSNRVETLVDEVFGGDASIADSDRDLSD